MKNFHIDKDNFNRHQMSFNAMSRYWNVAYSELAMERWRRLVLTSMGLRTSSAAAGTN